MTCILHWYGFLFRKKPQISRKKIREIDFTKFLKIYFEGGVFPNRFLDTEAPLGVVGWADLFCPCDLKKIKNKLKNIFLLVFFPSNQKV